MAVNANGGNEKRDSSQWALWIVRVVLGVIFFLHGGQKVFGWFGGHPLADSVTGMNSMLKIPVPLVYLSIFTEFLGGALLIVGFLTRIAGIGLFINMMVAIAMVHFKNGFFINGPAGPGFEYNVALMAMSLAVALGGPGVLAVDDLEGRALGKRN